MARVRVWGCGSSRTASGCAGRCPASSCPASITGSKVRGGRWSASESGECEPHYETRPTLRGMRRSVSRVRVWEARLSKPNMGRGGWPDYTSGQTGDEAEVQPPLMTKKKGKPWAGQKRREGTRETAPAGAAVSNLAQCSLSEAKTVSMAMRAHWRTSLTGSSTRGETAGRMRPATSSMLCSLAVATMAWKKAPLPPPSGLRPQPSPTIPLSCTSFHDLSYGCSSISARPPGGFEKGKRRYPSTQTRKHMLT